MPRRRVFVIDRDVKRSLERQRVVIDAELGQDLPPIRGDRVQLQQVLVNLLLNACEAMTDMPLGRRSITVASRRDDAGEVLVEVKDRGKDIDPAHAGRLFEAFFSTKLRGLGMGLAISRSIVEAHSGRIWGGAERRRPRHCDVLRAPAAPSSATG